MTKKQLNEAVNKNREISNAFVAALKNLRENDGKEGFRHDFDRAIHVQVALQEAGFSIIRTRRVS